MRSRYAAGMPTLTLLPLLIAAGVVALFVLWPRVQAGPSAPRLAIEGLLLAAGLAALLWGLMAVAA